MRKPEQLRQEVTAYAFLLFFFPVLIYTLYASTLLSWKDSWWLFLSGLLLAVGGTFLLTLQIWRWNEEEHQERLDRDTTLPIIPAPADEGDDWVERTSFHEEDTFQLQQSIEGLERRLSQSQGETDQRSRELDQQQKLNNSLEQQLNKMQDELRQMRESARSVLQDTESSLKASDETVQNFHQTLEKKDKYISELENIIADLRYEIKTLLNISVQPKNEIKRSVATPQPKEKPVALQKDLFIDLSLSPSATDKEAVQQLQRCIELAQKLTGVSPFENSSRFRDLGVAGGFALDQRRLFDSLSSETSGIVFVYSKKENKILFSNNQSRTLLGWGADKFTHDFIALMTNPAESWKKAVYSLSPLKTLIRTELQFKRKEGGELSLNCHLGLIPTGIFKGDIVGVMHPLDVAVTA